MNEDDTAFENSEDISLNPGSSADQETSINQYISEDVRKKYEVYSYRHAAAILANSFQEELRDIEAALLDFEITKRDIGMPGGNESIIPKLFSEILRSRDWLETRIQGDLLVKLQMSRNKGKEEKTHRIENFIDGHKIDYVKGRVAFDLEWNSKDQTFDRDLYAMRVFHECGLIDVGVLVTRSVSLNPVFDVIPQLKKDGTPEGKSVKHKYGASTTWMGKLLYRLNAGRHGGCPILVFGITPQVIVDL